MEWCKVKALKGLVIGCLAFVDVAAATALHGVAVQTPSSKELKARGKTLVNHYLEIIEKHIEAIKSVTSYLGLRFPVEFLIRDAKQHPGLEDCMARDQNKLHTHFNIAMTVVSIAKAAYHLSVPKEQRGSFSMADIKMMHNNQLIIKRIISNLALDLSCRKIKRIYNQCLNFGRLRA